LVQSSGNDRGGPIAGVVRAGSRDQHQGRRAGERERQQLQALRSSAR
jgi:hypothetical protein